MGMGMGLHLGSRVGVGLLVPIFEAPYSVCQCVNLAQYQSSLVGSIEKYKKCQWDRTFCLN